MNRPSRLKSGGAATLPDVRFVGTSRFKSRIQTSEALWVPVVYAARLSSGERLKPRGPETALVRVVMFPRRSNQTRGRWEPAFRKESKEGAHFGHVHLPDQRFGLTRGLSLAEVQAPDYQRVSPRIEEAIRW